MRLTVHLEKAEKRKEKVKTENGVKEITKTITTISFYDVEPEDVQSILNSIPEEKGIPVKHYLSNEKISGRA